VTRRHGGTPRNAGWVTLTCVDGGVILTGWDEAASLRYEQGLDLRHLSKPVLYRAAGYRKFEDLLKDRDLPTRVQAWKLISIVNNFDQQLAQSKGIQWCYAVLKYAAQKAGGNVRGLLARNPGALRRSHRLLGGFWDRVSCAVGVLAGLGLLEALLA
jgi:hypothetical protein